MKSLVALFTLLAGAANAQTTFASITGTVSDATGAAVPGAAITATHKDNNYQYKAESNASRYNIS
jgi:hypothetical protein